jgi:hypothetical protein
MLLRNKTIDTNPSGTITNVPQLSSLYLAIVLIVGAILFYQIYYHYWFTQLMGGRIIRLGLLILPLSFVALNYSMMQRQRFNIHRDSVTAINLMVVLYLLFNVLSIIVNEGQFEDARIYLFYTGYPVLLYFSFLIAYKTANQIKATMRFIFILAVILGVYALYYFLTYDTERLLAYYLSNRIEALGEIPIELTYGGSFTGSGGVRVERLTLLGLSSPNFASLLVLPIIIGLGFYKNTVGVRKWLYIAGSMFLFASLFLTYSRGALISLLCGILYLIWKRTFTRKDILAFMAIGVVIVGISGFGRMYTIAKHYGIRIAATDPVHALHGSPGPRLKVFYDSLRLWKECPLIGCGTTELVETQRDKFNSGDHNYYTRKLATIGLLGLLPFVMFITWLFVGVSLRESRLDQSQRWLSNTLGAGVVAVAVNLHMLVPAEPYHIWIWFALTAAWIRICSKYKRKENVISSSRL